MSASVLTYPWISTPSDGIRSSETLATQSDVENIISTLLTTHMTGSKPPTLQTADHLSFITAILAKPLPAGFVALDASRPWLIYWSLHSLALLDAQLDQKALSRIVETLQACQNEEGGFGGGPGQLSHLAPSYAAVCALSYCGQLGWDAIDREGLHQFLLSVKQPDGSFIMHQGGEVDVRGCYCALTIATLVNILTPSLARNTSSFIASCQTYEGGLASASQATPIAMHGAHPHAIPLGEAHGGYAYCAAASYFMLKPWKNAVVPVSWGSPDFESELDLKMLLRWATGLQATPIEGGGFRGRFNKLVDGCYSWWNGGLFGVIEGIMDDGDVKQRRDLYDRRALQEYVLLCAQAPYGGLRDKPGKSPDSYHTCYNLSGLSSAQHRYRCSSSSLATLANEFRSPFQPAKFLDLEEKKEVALVVDDGETEDTAECRMRACWSHSQAWEIVETVVVGVQDNKLVSDGRFC